MIRLIIRADGTVHVASLGTTTLEGLTTAQWQTLQLRWLDADGVPYLHATPVVIAVALKTSKTAAELLASASTFAAPGAAATGYYTGDISLITDALDALGDGATAYLEVTWTVASKLRRSDPLKLQLVKPLTTDEDAVPTDSTAAARAAYLAANILGGDNVTITPESDTGTITIDHDVAIQSGITAISINASAELVIIKSGVEYYAPLFIR